MEPRKASEILLELEKKLDIALNLIRTQDLNIKILSNKLNSLQEALGKVQAAPQKIVVEAVNTVRPQAPASPFQQTVELDLEKQIPVSSDFNLPLEEEPQGFRRTSRPETFAGDDVYLPQKYPTQLPKAPTPQQPRNPNAPPPGRTAGTNPLAEATVPSVATQKTEVPVAKPQPLTNQAAQNAVPVEQRVVNGHGRSLFLADVEIVDLKTMSSSKTRTNGSGKWMASLAVGDYRVLIKKYESATKETLESTQEIHIDGSQSPLQLQTVIIKPR